ncbi:MAG: DUF2971 domain-containing protein [Reyranella sp.]|nr:DUF2971 domain-containing protein [Reyranella sp.]
MAYLQYRPTQTLFQYTSVDGLFGILRSKHLRLSDLRAANDPKELELGYERVMQALKAVMEHEIKGATRENLLRLVEHLSGYFDRIQPFCSCFSLAVDELPMWAAYGQSYSGLAIGFRPAAILCIPARVQRVKYLDPLKETEEFKELALKIATRVGRNRNPNDIEQLVLASVDAVATTIALKHHIWAYEKEVRVVYTQLRERPEGALSMYPASMTPSGEPLYWREPLQRKVGTRSIMYVEFPFGRFRDGRIDPARALKTIIVGPNCSLSVADVEAELKEQGFYDCAVKKSDCHIRV